METLQSTFPLELARSPEHESAHSRRAELERRLAIAECVVMAFKRTPGLRLTASEAAQLLGCEDYVAARTLSALTEAYFLTCLGGGVFKRR
jgi:hypothetical protein